MTPSSPLHPCHCQLSIRQSTVAAVGSSLARRWRSSLSPLPPPPSPSSPPPPPSLSPSQSLLPSYATVVSSLHSINRRRAMVLGLSTMRSLLSSLPPSAYSPSLAPPSVHVTGSNGKGSVVWKVAAALQARGLKVGVFSSPHLSSFRERVTVDGAMITEEEVRRDVALLLSTAAASSPPLSPTFFELCTALAFVHFQRSAVDVAVVEVGLGGRLDSTNVISPRLAILTSIALEHTHILGDTVELICAEKCGIIKPRTPVLLGPTVPCEVVRPIAAQLQAEVFTLPPSASSSPHDLSSSLPSFDEENRAIASMALSLLERDELLRPLFRQPRDSDAVERALDTRPPCRYEQLTLPWPRPVLPPSASSPPLPTSPAAPPPVVSVLLDVAHNPSAVVRLMARVRADCPPPRPIRAVFGMSADKDIEGCLTPLLSHCQSIHFVSPSHSPRAASITRLRQAVARVLAAKRAEGGGNEEMAVVEEVVEEGEVEPSVVAALRRCGEGDGSCAPSPLLLITGSFALFRDARKGLGLHFPTDPLDLNESSLTAPAPPLDSPSLTAPPSSSSSSVARSASSPLCLGSTPSQSVGRSSCGEEWRLAGRSPSSRAFASVTSSTPSPALPSPPSRPFSTSASTPSSSPSPLPSHRSRVLRLYREMLHLSSQVRSTPLTVTPYRDVQRAFREKAAIPLTEGERLHRAVKEAEAKAAMLRTLVPITGHRKREVREVDPPSPSSASTSPSSPSPVPPSSSSTSAWRAGYDRVFGPPPPSTQEGEVGEGGEGRASWMAVEGDGVQRFVFDAFGEVVVPLTEEQRLKVKGERGQGAQRLSNSQGVTDEQRLRHQRLIERFQFKGPHWKGKR